MLSALRHFLLGSDAERLIGARSELERVEADLNTLKTMLNIDRDSFHHSLAESTEHETHLLERRAKLIEKINQLERRALRRKEN